MITNSSFQEPKSKSGGDPSSALSISAALFPSFQTVHLKLDQAEAFTEAFLLPQKLNPAHNVLPQSHQDAMVHQPQMLELFLKSRQVSEITSPTILICGHGGRDSRCGIMGPLLLTEFKSHLEKKGFAVSTAEPWIQVSDREAQMEDKPVANLGLISHIGGHKFAGNVIIYLPPASTLGRPLNDLAGYGIWYGRVEPKHVEGIIEKTLLEGVVIRELFRGGVKGTGEMLRLE